MTSQQLIEVRKKRGEVLELTRRKFHISKVDLSIKTGLSRDTIDRIEKGLTSWTVDTETLYLSGLKLN